MKRENLLKYTNEHKLYVDTVMGLFFLFFSAVLIVLGILSIVNHYVSGIYYDIAEFVVGLIVFVIALLILRIRI
ncbi:MAG: hypothetical protein QXJ93_00535 [Candidatus Rehaiarchaeum fermentans]|nr:hypothetical protein [Candidatus Rehaiarchaeum fermentans]MCW1311315.1 hypothetical protein [Candidatus Rehaiarchaeum fermentans]